MTFQSRERAVTQRRTLLSANHSGDCNARSARREWAEFPARIQRAVRASWRETEPTEGGYDFSGVRQEILKESEGGKFAIKLGLGASVWETPPRSALARTQ